MSLHINNRVDTTTSSVFTLIQTNDLGTKKRQTPEQLLVKVNSKVADNFCLKFAPS